VEIIFRIIAAPPLAMLVLFSAVLIIFLKCHSSLSQDHLVHSVFDSAFRLLELLGVS
jgi:hypothetical protein